MKTLPHAPEGFFEAEAAGLRWLSEVDGGVPHALTDVCPCDLLRTITNEKRRRQAPNLH